MGLATAVGHFSTGTGAVNSTVSVSGLGFQPKVLLCWWSGRTETADTTARRTHMRGYGCAASATSRWYVTSGSQDTPTTMVAKHAQGTDACVAIFGTTPTALDGKLDFTSFDAGGFTLTVTDAFTASFTVSYLALGGTDITNVAAGSFQSPVVTGTQDQTGPGFQPDFLLIAATGQATNDGTIASDSACTLGFASGPAAANQVVWSGGSNDGSATSVTNAYCTSGQIGVAWAAAMTSLNIQFALNAWLSTGFQLNYSVVPAGAGWINYLAIKGGRWSVGDLLSATSLTTVAETGVGFTPSALLALSAMRAKSTAGTVSAHDQWSLGAATDATHREAQAVVDQNAAATAITGSSVYVDELYVNLTTAAAMQGLADVQSMDADGFTLVMDDADPAQEYVAYMAVAPSAVVQYGTAGSTAQEAGKKATSAAQTATGGAHESGAGIRATTGAQGATAGAHASVVGAKAESAAQGASAGGHASLVAAKAESHSQAATAGASALLAGAKSSSVAQRASAGAESLAAGMRAATISQRASSGSHAATAGARASAASQVATSGSHTAQTGAKAEAASQRGSAGGSAATGGTSARSGVQVARAGGRLTLVAVRALSHAQLGSAGAHLLMGSPSGVPMPIGNLPGWRQIFTDDFLTSVPIGSWPTAVSSKWYGYLDTWTDTSGNGTYYPSKVVSQAGGCLDLYLHTELIGGVQTHLVAAPLPILAAGIHPYGVGLAAGRYVIRFRADSLPGYKTAWLLWPDNENWPADGEIDFPEGALDSTISGFVHLEGATSGSDQDAYGTTTTYTDWHTAVIEWRPEIEDTKFYLDGVLVGHSTARIPNTLMHWVIQTETSTSGVVPDNATAGHVQIDWVVVYVPSMDLAGDERGSAGGGAPVQGSRAGARAVVLSAGGHALQLGATTRLAPQIATAGASSPATGVRAASAMQLSHAGAACQTSGVHLEAGITPPQAGHAGAHSQITGSKGAARAETATSGDRALESGRKAAAAGALAESGASAHTAGVVQIPEAHSAAQTGSLGASARVVGLRGTAAAARGATGARLQTAGTPLAPAFSAAQRGSLGLGGRCAGQKTAAVAQRASGGVQLATSAPPHRALRTMLVATRAADVSLAAGEAFGGTLRASRARDGALSASLAEDAALESGRALVGTLEGHA